MPTQSSSSAGHVDSLFSALFWLSTLSAAGVAFAMVYFVLRYRAKSRQAPVEETKESHNTLLEITWSVVPLFIVIGLFVYGFKGYIDLRNAPKDSMEIHVTGQKWKWLFAYPNGLTEDTLHVPVDTPVRLILNSTDVIHSLYVPAFRVKMDAVPGRYTDLWFRATEVGEFPVFCTEYCGTSHSDMLAKVIVHEPGGFEKWMDAREQEIMDKPPAELGKLLYEQQGCSTCHSTDGSPRVGPTFKGIFGKAESFTDGSSLTIDENYLRQSILEPNAKIVKGYSPAMPTYQGKLNDRELNGLVEYIKTLK
jgi:cytochrome c oxidase subunit 2